MTEAQKGARYFEASLLHVVGFGATLLGCLLAAASIHSQLVVPAIMRQVQIEIQGAVGIHASKPHEGAVRRDDMAAILMKLEQMPTKNDLGYLKERLDNIETRLRAIEAQRGKL